MTIIEWQLILAVDRQRTSYSRAMTSDVDIAATEHDAKTAHVPESASIGRVVNARILPARQRTASSAFGSECLASGLTLAERHPQYRSIT